MKQTFWVRHSAFKPYKVSFPIQWRLINPYKNKNWLHHFNSLRWLLNEGNENLIFDVLRSFYNYHCVKKVNNPYYFDLRGDHTGAIRLGVLCALKEKFQIEMSELNRIASICNRLIREEIKNLQRPEIYREGTNHALMLDLTLLKTIITYPQYIKLVNLPLIRERSAKTVDSIWFENGLTKEHSISYQEYNLPLALEYFSLLETLAIEPDCNVQLADILHESKKLLGYALKGNGEYFPLGDSFREPKPQLLEKIYLNEAKVGSSVHELLAPYSNEDGYYGNDHFFIYRKTLNGKKIHFATTCCWDSYTHKQDDELSFCLEVDGVSLFDDAGYSEFVSRERVLAFASAQSHSTIQISGIPWSDGLTPNGKSRILKFNIEQNGFEIEMQCERVQGVLFNRKFRLDKDGLFLVKDVISGDLPKSFEILRRFVCGQDIQINESKNNCLELLNNQKKVATIQFFSTQFLKDEIHHDEKIELVMSDRKQVTSVGTMQHMVKPLEVDFVTDRIVALTEVRL